jgi:AcrR family transcriptional regulator
LPGVDLAPDSVAGAVEAFWSHGYAATTLDELERATGVDRSTIYNSSGGRRGLYDRAAMAYLGRGEDQLLSPLTAGDAGLDDIVEFLDRLQANLVDESTPPGCLIINDITTPTNLEITDRYLTTLRRGFSDAIDRSNHTDETDADHNTGPRRVAGRRDHRNQHLTPPRPHRTSHRDDRRTPRPRPPVASDRQGTTDG